MVSHQFALYPGLLSGDRDHRGQGGPVLTAMSVATVLFCPAAGCLLDNFNHHHIHLLFLALFCLPFPAFLAFLAFAC